MGTLLASGTQDRRGRETVLRKNFPDPGYTTSSYFHDSICVNNIGVTQNPWSDDWSVWNCRLIGLLDVATEKCRSADKGQGVLEHTH